MRLSIASLIFAVTLISQAHPVNADENQVSLSITNRTVDSFRQISVRILSAYKAPPHYIGSTSQWHLFLKKETREALDKQFTTIFGYKISRKSSPVDNGWEISLPVIEIDPDNCPQVSDFWDDKTGFSLPADTEISATCISR